MRSGWAAAAGEAAAEAPLAGAAGATPVPGGTAAVDAAPAATAGALLVACWAPRPAGEGCRGPAACGSRSPTAGGDAPGAARGSATGESCRALLRVAAGRSQLEAARRGPHVAVRQEGSR